MSVQDGPIGVPEWDLADRLRKAKRAAGVGSQDLADLLGVHRRTIANYVNGHTRPPASAVRVWAIRCGVPYEWLRSGAVTTEGSEPTGGGGPGAPGEYPPWDSNPEPAGSTIVPLTRPAPPLKVA